MTDAEISRRLALAIGWREDQDDPDVIIEFNCKDWDQAARCKVWFDDSWREFDYRDPAVIWPIAERFNAFPVASSFGYWFAYDDITNAKGEGSTAAKAVAIAVIKAHEGAKE